MNDEAWIAALTGLEGPLGALVGGLAPELRVELQLVAAHHARKPAVERLVELLQRPSAWRPVHLSEAHVRHPRVAVRLLSIHERQQRLSFDRPLSRVLVHALRVAMSRLSRLERSDSAALASKARSARVALWALSRSEVLRDVGAMRPRDLRDRALRAAHGGLVWRLWTLVHEPPEESAT